MSKITPNTGILISGPAEQVIQSLEGIPENHMIFAIDITQMCSRQSESSTIATLLRAITPAMHQACDTDQRCLSVIETLVTMIEVGGLEGQDIDVT